MAFPTGAYMDVNPGAMTPQADNTNITAFTESGPSTVAATIVATPKYRTAASAPGIAAGGKPVISVTTADGLTFGNPSGWNNTGATFLVVAMPISTTISGGSTGGFIFQPATTLAMYCKREGNGVYLGNNSGTLGHRGPDKPNCHIYTVAGSGTSLHASYGDGRVRRIKRNTALVANVVAGFRVGLSSYGAGFGFAGYIVRIMAWARVLTEAEIQQAEAEVQSLYYTAAALPTLDTGKIIVTGENSFTTVYGALGEGGLWPDFVQTARGNNEVFINTGVVGDTWTNAATGFTNAIAQINAFSGTPYFLAMEGQNAIGAGPTVALAGLNTYCTTVRTAYPAGKIIATNIYGPWPNTGTPTTIPADQTTYNDSLATHYETTEVSAGSLLYARKAGESSIWPDYLLKMSAAPLLGDPAGFGGAAVSGTVYWSGNHPIGPGQTLIASYTNTALTAALYTITGVTIDQGSSKSYSALSQSEALTYTQAGTGTQPPATWSRAGGSGQAGSINASTGTYTTAATIGTVANVDVFTITTVNGFTATYTVTTAAYGTGGQSGMTLEDCVNVTATSGQWNEVKQRDGSSMTGKKFELIPLNEKSGDAIYSIADTEGNISGYTRVSTSIPMRQQDQVATGKKLFLQGYGVTTPFSVKIGS